MEYTLQWLMENDGFSCECGRRHYGLLKDCIIGEDALLRLPEMVRKYNGTHPFVLCDRETYAAAGERACALLEGAEIPYTLHIIGRTRPAPDERIVGEAVMFCDAKCDLVIAVGGGVINDTGKILAAAKNCTDIYVAAAPSIGEAEILAKAPVHMIRSGIGDMAAKYISLVEWQIAALLVGDYYCPTVANIVKESLAVCAENAAAAVSGDREAVCRLAEGLVMSGLAMNYAGISRPASGMEHYISHILDMRALEFGAPADLHGIQCGIATLITAEAYELLAKIVPDREKALAYVKNFSLESWSDHLRALLGHGAQAMIAGEKKEGKYDPEKHAARLEKILANWETILEIVSGLPSAADLRTFFVSIGHPVSGGEIGLTSDDMRQAFLAAKDIRDKYVLGRLLWDLGELESTAEALCL